MWGRRCETKVCSSWLQIDFLPHLQKQTGKTDWKKQTDVAYTRLQNRKKQNSEKKNYRAVRWFPHFVFSRSEIFFYKKKQDFKKISCRNKFMLAKSLQDILPPSSKARCDAEGNDCLICTSLHHPCTRA